MNDRLKEMESIANTRLGEVGEVFKKEGYEFQNKLEDWPKPNETLITIPKQNLQQRIEQITNPTEPKKEEIIKKPSFWDKIRK